MCVRERKSERVNLWQNEQRYTTVVAQLECNLFRFLTVSMHVLLETR